MTGTRNLLEACESIESIERLVFVSSAAVYRPENEPHNEIDALDLVCIYGCTKLVVENLVNKYHQDIGVDTVLLHLFNIYRQSDTDDHLVPAISNQIENDREEIELEEPLFKKEFVYVSDITNAFITALTEIKTSTQHYNAGTRESYSLREVAEATSKMIGRHIEMQQDEDRVKKSDRPHLCADSTLLHRDTSWEPTVSLLDGRQ